MRRRGRGALPRLCGACFRRLFVRWAFEFDTALRIDVGGAFGIGESRRLLAGNCGADPGCSNSDSTVSAANPFAASRRAVFALRPERATISAARSGSGATRPSASPIVVRGHAFSLELEADGLVAIAPRGERGCPGRGEARVVEVARALECLQGRSHALPARRRVAPAARRRRRSSDRAFSGRPPRLRAPRCAAARARAFVRAGGRGPPGREARADHRRAGGAPRLAVELHAHAAGRSARAR